MPPLTSMLLALQDALPDGAIERGSDAIEETWRFLEMPAMWIVALLIVPGSLAIAAIAYSRESLSRPMRWTLVGLRTLSFLLLFAVLFRPVFVRQEQSVIAPEVLFLFDGSGSMAREDGYVGDDEARDAVRALTGESADSVSRIELAEAVRPRLLSAAREAGYVPRALRFADDVTPLADGARLDARGASTAIGDAIRGALAGARGRYVTDIVLVSDGRSNVGTPPDEVAAAARAAGVAIDTVLVGDDRTEVNVAVELVDAPEAVLEGDQIAVAARVSARGTEGSASLLLEEVSARDPENVRLVASEEVPLVESGDRIVLVAGRDAVDFGAGERRFRLRVAPLEGERVTDDNQVTVSVRVNRQKVRVLYVEGYPRHEYRFLNWELKRMDERIDVQLFLLSADAEFQQERTKGLASLKRVPTTREELLENYDVVILGDVNPYDISPDPSKGEEFVRSLREFVERGGGLCVIAGRYDMPRAIAGTEFSEMLPVELDRAGATLLDVPTTETWRYRLESPAAPHEIVTLVEDVERNRLLWEDPQGLHGFYWHYPVRGAKPGAEVLLRHPEARYGGGDEPDPLLVAGYFPSGRTLFLSIEASWMWRNRFGHLYYDTFWRGALRWLALGRMRSGDRRFQLEALRSTYDIADRVTLEARVLDDDFRPSEAATQEIVLEDPDGEERPLDLSLVSGRAGLFRGTFQPERPGRHVVRIRAGGGGPEIDVTAEFDVQLPSRESADLSPDPEGMARLASLSGGVSATALHLDPLLEQAFPADQERREPVSSQLEDAWDRWATLILALLLLGAEWVLRKRAELV